MKEIFLNIKNNLFNNLDFNKINYKFLLKRFLSYSIDTIIIFIITFFIIFFYIKDDINIFKDEDNNIDITKTIDTITQQKENLLAKIYKDKTLNYLILFTNLLYFIIFIIIPKQATIGQQIVGLIVININGTKLNIFEAINRTCLFSILKILSILVFFSKKNITIYDFFSKTRVIEL